MALIKSAEDIAKLRIAGKKLAGILAMAAEQVRPGLTLAELEASIHQAILAEDAKPSFLGYQGFPAASCLSLNQQVVHGIPDTRVLSDGDLLGIDVGLWFQEVCVDSARTVAIGETTPEQDHLLKATEEALEAGIRAARPYRRVGSISQAIQDSAESAGLGIVRALTGHGVGHHVHESPEIPNVGRTGDGALLRPGMVLAIEPMLTLGSGDVLTEIDGWGIVTADDSLSAHFEHTVVITHKGVEILTKI